MGIYISQVSILKLHASQSSGILWELKLPRAFCRWGGNMINMSNQVFIISNALRAHRLYRTLMLYLWLNSSKNKRFWKAALLHACVCLANAVSRRPTESIWFDGFWSFEWLNRKSCRRYNHRMSMRLRISSHDTVFLCGQKVGQLYWYPVNGFRSA